MKQRKGYFVGVDIGKTNIRVALSDGSRTLKNMKKRAYNKKRDFDLFDEINE